MRREFYTFSRVFSVVYIIAQVSLPPTSFPVCPIGHIPIVMCLILNILKFHARQWRCHTRFLIPSTSLKNLQSCMIMIISTTRPVNLLWVICLVEGSRVELEGANEKSEP